MVHKAAAHRVLDQVRLNALRKSGLLDGAPEEAFDRLTRLASLLLGTPVALMSLVDEDRQFFKSAVGLREPFASARETPLSHSFCQHVIASGEPLVVADARRDPLLHDNLAISELGVVAYAGIPLVTQDGQALGALCVADSEPRAFSAEQIDALKTLASAVVTEIELRAQLMGSRESEAMFRAFIESANDAVVTTQADGRIAFWNEAAERMFGYPPHEVLGKPLEILIPERFRAAHRAGMQRVLASGRSDLVGRTVDLVGLRKGGVEFSVQLSLARTASERGRLFVGIMRDVTQRDLQAQALRRAEEQLRLAIDNAPIGMALIELTGRFLRVNRALSQIVGYEPDELTALTFHQITSPEDLPSDLELVERLLRGEIQRYQLDKHYTHKDGSRVPVSLHVSLMRDAQGAPQHFIAQVIDMREKLRAQAELADKTAILESVLQHMDDAVLVARPTELLLANPAAQRMLGPLADLPPNEWPEGHGMFGAEDRPALPIEALPLMRALRGEQVQQCELFVRSGGPSEGRWHSVNASPLRDIKGNVWGAVAVGRDITRMKQNELVLREHADTILLLQTIAVAANAASDVAQAVEESLKRVCEFMRWPLGHAYLVAGDSLVSSELWHVQDPERFAAFRDVTSRTQLVSGLGLPGRVLATGRAAWTEDMQRERFPRAPIAAKVGLRGGLAFPVLVGSEVCAVLEFYSEQEGAPDARVLDVMHHVGTQLGRVMEREQHAEAVRSLSLTDELTGLNNRRGFLALAEAQLRSSARLGRRAQLLFLDMDGLKQINDQLGHESGDEALLELARVLRATFRDFDILGRLGGDEFVALLPEAGDSGGEALARFQENLVRHNLSAERPYVLSVSVGVTVFDPGHPESIDELLARADAAMYEQKNKRKALRVQSPLVRRVVS